MFNPKLGEKPAPLSYNELILERLKELKDGQRELKAELQATKHELNDRMDRIETRMDRIETRMGGIESEMRNVGRHSQIMTASVVGIALAVVYFIFTH